MKRSLRLMIVCLFVIFFSAGCTQSPAVTEPDLSDSVLQLSKSDLKAQTQQNPQQVFDLALARTLSGNGVQIQNGSRISQLICVESTFWLIQEDGNSWSCERQASNESQVFGLIKDDDGWTVSLPLTTHDLTDQDISQYLNDTDRLRMQLKTFLSRDRTACCLDFLENGNGKVRLLCATVETICFSLFPAIPVSLNQKQSQAGICRLQII